MNDRNGRLAHRAVRAYVSCMNATRIRIAGLAAAAGLVVPLFSMLGPLFIAGVPVSGLLVGYVLSREGGGDSRDVRRAAVCLGVSFLFPGAILFALVMTLMGGGPTPAEAAFGLAGSFGLAAGVGVRLCGGPHRHAAVGFALGGALAGVLIFSHDVLSLIAFPVAYAVGGSATGALPTSTDPIRDSEQEGHAQE
jgi:hypothetical protein